MSNKTNKWSNTCSWTYQNQRCTAAAPKTQVSCGASNAPTQPSVQQKKSLPGFGAAAAIFLLFFITTTASHETENSFSMSFFVHEFLLYKKIYKMSFCTFWVMGTPKVGNSRQKLTKKFGFHRL